MCQSAKNLTPLTPPPGPSHMYVAGKLLQEPGRCTGGEDRVAEAGEEEKQHSTVS